MDIRIEGLDNLDARIDKIIRNKSKIRTALMWGASEVQRSAMRLVPVRTGDLKRSIHIEEHDAGLTFIVEAATEYAAYVEWGTRFMEAQPYMRPGAEKIAEPLTELVKEALDG